MGIGVFCDILIILVDYRNPVNLVSVFSNPVLESHRKGLSADKQICLGQIWQILSTVCMD